MNLKLRLNIIITVLLLLIMLIGASFTIKNARTNIQAEIASTAILALYMLNSEIASLKTKGHTVNDGTPIFKLDTLKNVRHLKIDFFDVSGQLKDSNRSEKDQ